MFADLTVPRTPSFNEASVADKHADVANLPLLDSAEIGQMDELYRQRVRAMQAVDETVARVVEALYLSGQLQNTYLVFASDNGFHMGQHRLRQGKGTPYEEDIVVPLIVRGPGVPAGRTCDALTALTDLMPTFVDLAGAVLPDYVDGRSLVPHLLGQAGVEQRQVVLIEGFSLSLTFFVGLRGKESKFVEFHTGELEQYDLVRDPYELHSLHTRTARTELLALHRWLEALSRCTSQDCRALENGPPVLPWGYLPVVGR